MSAHPATLGPRPGGVGIRAVLRIVGSETVKALNGVWAHRITILFELAALSATYLAIQFFVGDGHLVRALLPPTLLGFTAYVFAYITALKMSAGVAEEMNTGTFEQCHLSPVPSWVLSAGRLGGVAAEGVCVAAVLTTALALAFGVDFPPHWSALLPAVLTLADIAGFALLIAGLTVVVKSIAAVLHVIESAIFMLNGMVVPVNLFPAWLEVIARLVPSTQGIDVTRRVLLDGQSLTQTWTDHALLWLVIHATGMLVVGWSAYQWSVRRGLRDGRLGP